jgi:hypothetical protein
MGPRVAYANAKNAEQELERVHELLKGLSWWQLARINRALEKEPGIGTIPTFLSNPKSTTSEGSRYETARINEYTKSVKDRSDLLESLIYEQKNPEAFAKEKLAAESLFRVMNKGNPYVAANRTPAARLADKAQNLPASQRPNTVAVIKTQDGRIIVGRNQGGVVNQGVQNVLDDILANQFNRQCAEVNAVSRAQNKGVNLSGAEISVSNVRGPSSTTGVHGTPKPPCNVCEPLLDNYGVNYTQ